VGALKEFDDVTLLDWRCRLDPPPIDLDMAATASLGGLAAMLDQANQLEPDIDSMSLIHKEL
jgi:hypothetical protein